MDGEYVDTYIYSILKPDWKKNSKSLIKHIFRKHISKAKLCKK